MSRILWKSFYLCFPSNLIKCSSSPPCLPPPSSAVDDQDNLNCPSRLFRSLNYSRSCRRDDDSSGHSLSKGLATAPSTASPSTPTTTATVSSSDDFANYDTIPDDDHSTLANLTAAFASRRFFLSSPGRSNAITDSPETHDRQVYDNCNNATTIIAATTKGNINTSTAVTTQSTTIPRLLNGGAAVKQYVYSQDPYRDFRQSMEEMIEAMDVKDQARPVDETYKFLQELLFSYLSLNPRDTHEFVVRAFVDILVSILSDSRRKFRRPGGEQ